MARGAIPGYSEKFDDFEETQIGHLVMPKFGGRQFRVLEDPASANLPQSSDGLEIHPFGAKNAAKCPDFTA